MGGTSRTGAVPDYAPMSPEELRDLEREAGRPLTERQALEFLLRKRKRQAVQRMLEKKSA